MSGGQGFSGGSYTYIIWSARIVDFEGDPLASPQALPPVRGRSVTCQRPSYVPRLEAKKVGSVVFKASICGAHSKGSRIV